MRVTPDSNLFHELVLSLRMQTIQNFSNKDLNLSLKTKTFYSENKKV